MGCQEGDACREWVQSHGTKGRGRLQAHYGREMPQLSQCCCFLCFFFFFCPSVGAVMVFFTCCVFAQGFTAHYAAAD